MQVNNAKAVGEAARELDIAVVVGAWVFLNADHTHTLEKAEPVATVKTAVRSARMHRKMWECTARRLRKPPKRAGWKLSAVTVWDSNQRRAQRSNRRQNPEMIYSPKDNNAAQA
jgi:hypothetical protein